MQLNSSIIVMDGLQFQTLLNKIDSIHQLLCSSNKDNESEELLSTQEAARKLKVCSKTIINLIEDGKLGAIKFNKGEGRRGHYKISKSEINKFIKIYRLGY